MTGTPDEAPAPLTYQQGGTQRLQSLTDGVFSIVMTLLVFDLAPVSNLTGDLSSKLAALVPGLVGFGISVGLVGIYWGAHHAIFQMIERTDPGLNWLNLVFLAAVSLVPVSTRLVTHYYDDPRGLALYASNMAAVGYTLMTLWLYAAVGHRRLVAGLPPGTLGYGLSRCVFGAASYTLAAGLAFASTSAALVFLALVPMPYVLPPLNVAWVRWFGVERRPGGAGGRAGPG